jgi:predicted RNA-binding protein YlxR (DUF448 family)
VACGKGFPRERLLRFVRDPGGTVKADPGGGLQGRGAYLCDAPQCTERVQDGRAFARSFRAPTTVEEDTLDFIREWQRREFTK